MVDKCDSNMTIWLINLTKLIKKQKIHNMDKETMVDFDSSGFCWNDKTNQLETKIINPELEGEQQDCQKGEETKKYIEDNDTNDDDESESNEESLEEITQVEEDKKEKHKQILKEVCKRVLFPLLSLLSRIYQQLEFKDMLFNTDTKKIITSILHLWRFKTPILYLF